jgi:hypothetical protein
VQALIDQIEELKNDSSNVVGTISLHSSYIQSANELIVTSLLPNISQQENCDGLYAQLKIPQWIKDSLYLGYFLQYFSDGSSLTNDLLREIYNESDISSQWNKIITIVNIVENMTRE